MNKFSKVAINIGSDKYTQSISRISLLAKRENDVRSPFTRDYTRILHSRAYSRLKHKTQVFFATQNDHICTRIEHVERFLSELTYKYLNEKFWHEKNSLRFVDKYETLQDSNGFEQNLNLTYAVRDGIISHCGEVEDAYLVPRKEAIDLDDIIRANQYSPYTWEGCVVKLADNIAYIGRDIEDALRLKILEEQHLDELNKIINNYANIDIKKTNNTTLIHTFVSDLCENSNLENGMRFSTHHLEFMKEIKQFNAKLILNSIFNVMMKFYDGINTVENINKEYMEIYPELCKTFIEKLKRYSDMGHKEIRRETLQNTLLYKLDNEQDFIKAIIDYISSMTDKFAIKIFDELTTL